jgi:hypothetical protein
MNIWYPQYGRQNATTDTLEILDNVEAHLSQCGDPRPLIRSVRVGAGWEHNTDFGVEVQLCPGVILNVGYQSVDDEERDPENLHHGWGVGIEVAESVKKHGAHGVDVLADSLHALRTRIRKALATFTHDGVYALLGEIFISCTDYGRLGDTFEIEVPLTGLDSDLRPCNAGLTLQGFNDLDEQLVGWHQTQSARFAKSRALMADGADGTVDQLAVNAIAQFDDVSEVLRGMTASGFFPLCQSVTTFVVEGHLQCHGWDRSNPNFHWNRDKVIIANADIPATILTTVVGRPITAVVDHPLLTDRMIITSAVSKDEWGKRFVELQFDQPKLLFCRASGRVWEAESA